MLVPRREFIRYAAATTALGTIALGMGRAAFAAGRPSLVLAVSDNPETLEPAKELSNVGTRITYNVFDTLIRRDFLSDAGGGGATLVPHLATSWRRIDGNGLELTLRQGVKFHNGDELTADDVAFTFSSTRLLGDKAPIAEGKAYFGILDRVEAVDRYTVRFFTKTPDALLEQRLASWASWIVNKRAWLADGVDGFGKKPVGTGPYKCKEIRSGEHIRLEAFDDYFMGKPTAQTITFKVIPEVAARISGLVSGEYDMIVNVPPDQIDMINGYSDIETRSVVLANSHVLVYNASHPVLADKRVRQALNLAIDRKLLVKTLWRNEAVVPPSHQYPEYGEMFDASRPIPEYNPEKARQRLAEAGYKGEPVVYYTQPNYYVNALAAAQILIEMWKAVGVNAQLQVVENFKQVSAEQMMIRNWSNSTRYPDHLGALWVAWGPEGSSQKTWKMWKAPQAFNDLGRKLESSLDMKARFQLAKSMLDIWEDDAPGTVLYQPLETYAVKKSIKWRPVTFYYMDLRPYNLQFPGA